MHYPQHKLCTFSFTKTQRMAKSWVCHLYVSTLSFVCFVIIAASASEVPTGYCGHSLCVCVYRWFVAWGRLTCRPVSLMWDHLQADQIETDRFLSCQFDQKLLKLTPKLISSSSFRRQRPNSGGNLHIGLIEMNEASVSAEHYPSSVLTLGAGGGILPCYTVT